MRRLSYMYVAIGAKHWTGLLEPAYEPAFTTAVRAALDRGVRFRILLTDPSSPDAAERARQVAPTDALALMRQNIERLDEFRHEIPARLRPRDARAGDGPLLRQVRPRRERRPAAPHPSLTVASRICATPEGAWRFDDDRR